MDFIRELFAERFAHVVALVTLLAVAPSTHTARADELAIGATAPEVEQVCVWGIEPPGPESCAP